MVKVVDLKENGRDTLARLVDQVKNPKTVPHGVKIAGANEATVYYDSNDVAHTWDGDTINDYDARMAEATRLLEEGKKRMDQLQADLTSAEERITAASGDLSGYIDKIEAAQKTADEANASLTAMGDQLKATNADLEKVTATAGSISDSISSLDSQIASLESNVTSANDRATSATEAANQAAADAAQVAATAQNAQTAAEQAQNKALEAAGIAGGKGKVIYGSSEPAVADRSTNNLWIQTPSNTPKRWDGSAWVAVTDTVAQNAATAAATAKRVADKAVTDAATAKQTADKAVADAAAAQTLAEKAAKDAGLAVTSANGKNTNYFTKTAPPNPIPGDLWITDGSIKTWDGSAWKLYTDPSIAVAQKAADTAQATASGKTTSYRQSTTPPTTGRVAGDIWFNTAEGNKVYVWNGTAWAASQDTAIQTLSDKVATIQKTAVTESGNFIFRQPTAPTAKKVGDTWFDTANGNVMKVWNGSAWDSNIFSAPALGSGAVTADKLGDLAVTAGKLAGGAVTATKIASAAVGTAAIADAAVETAKIKDAAITDAKIQNLNAGKITAGTLDAARIGANTITADKLVIGVGDNVIPNGEGQDRSGWSDFGFNHSGAAANNGYYGSFWLKGATSKHTDLFPTAPGVYRFSIDIKASFEGSSVYVQVLSFDASGTRITPSPYPVLNQNPPNGSWKTYSGEVTIPPGTVKSQLLIYAQHRAGVQNPNGYQWFTGASLRQKKDGSLIVKGTITGDKIAAGAITADSGIIGSLDASVISTGTLSADRIGTGALTPDKLKDKSITASKIVDGTISGVLIQDNAVTATKMAAGTITANSGIIASLDAGVISVGTLNSARIASNSITTDKLLVGVGDNLLPPLSASANILGAPKEWIGQNGENGSTSITVPASTSFTGTYISSVRDGDYLVPIEPGEDYRVSVRVKAEDDSPTKTAVLYVRYVDDKGGWTFTTPSTVSIVPNGSWQTLSGLFPYPQKGIRYTKMLIGFYVSGGNTVATTFADPAIRKMRDGSLIVNGSITGDKVDAQSVAAKVGQFVQVDAKNIAVTEKLAANIVNAMSTTTKRLVVTEDALLNNAVFLGKTVADQLNVTKKLVARDAIVDGTLDVKQLNVTRELGAAVVNAMDVATKQLIVTEDAILNRATVVQSLVTPELISKKIKADQFDARYAKISDLTAGNLTITGTFRSGKVGGAGVVIPQNFVNVAGLSQLGVWLTRDGKAPGTDAASAWGVTSGIWSDQVNNDSNSITPINIRGQNGGGVRVWGGMTVADKNNNGYITPFAGGSMNIKGYADLRLTGNYGVRMIAGDVAHLEGANGMVIASNGNIALRDLAGRAYNKTYSGSGLVNLVLGSGSGRIYVQSSSKRFKTNITTMEPDDQWLDLRTVWYNDKESIRVRDEVLAREASGDTTPRSEYEKERIADAGRLTAGRIAEEAASIGSSQVVYEADGETPLSYDYARDGVMLIPHVRRNRDTIRELTDRVAKLEELVYKLCQMN